MTQDSTYRNDSAMVEAKVIEMLKVVLNCAEVAPEDDFFFLGGDSLKAVEFMLAVEETFGIAFDPVAILEQPTAKGLATVIFDALTEAPA